MPRAATNADVFHAVAEPHRRAILDLLAAEARPVGEVVRALRIAQPSVSKHLRVLRETGLVEARRDGKRILYRTVASAIRPMHEWTGLFEKYWGHQLGRVKARAEAAHRNPTRR